MLNLSKCQRKLGDWEGAVESATRVLETPFSDHGQADRGHHDGDRSQSHLTALHARAKAYKESGQLELAQSDLTEALRLSPNNRDLHKMILQVKESLRQEEVGAVGADINAEDIKYLDETVSDIGVTSDNSSSKCPVTMN